MNMDHKNREAAVIARVKPNLESNKHFWRTYYVDKDGNESEPFCDVSSETEAKSAAAAFNLPLEPLSEIVKSQCKTGFKPRQALNKPLVS